MYSLREIKKLHEANAVIRNYHLHPDDSEKKQINI